jgi:integrase/recombinase XerD
MPGAFKRKSDAARGKAGKWTGWFLDEHGKQKQFAGTTDKAGTLEIARAKEAEARFVRAGLLDRRDARRRDAARETIDSHVEDYRLTLIDRADGQKHAAHVAGVLLRLLADAGVASTADLAADRIQAALGRLKARGRSARTCNHALGAARAFCGWLADGNRIAEVPRGLASIPRYNEEADRRRVRRALSRAEMGRLLAAAEQGQDVACWPRRSKTLAVAVPGPERAALYRVAMATGFRDRELRSLAPEAFALDGDDPTVTVAAAYSKNGRAAAQPIARDVAVALRPWLAAKAPGSPVFRYPWSAARMLRRDLEAAGIPYRSPAGVVDFHALRHSYISGLIESGVDPKTVQVLARHSTITLTIDRYSHTDAGRKRKAVEGGS